MTAELTLLDSIADSDQEDIESLLAALEELDAIEPEIITPPDRPERLPVKDDVAVEEATEQQNEDTDNQDMSALIEKIQDTYTVKELKQTAKQLGLRGYSGLRELELIDLLLANGWHP